MKIDFKLFGVSIWQHSYGKIFLMVDPWYRPMPGKYFWFRFFGYGLLIESDKSEMLFSEKNGYRKSISLFGYKIKWLS
jgi:hypothetical protein